MVELPIAGVASVAYHSIVAPRRLLIGSRCPKCRELRIVNDYTRQELQHRLDYGQAIQGRCPVCDETWDFTPRERTAIARGFADSLH